MPKKTVDESYYNQRLHEYGISDALNKIGEVGKTIQKYFTPHEEGISIWYPSLQTEGFQKYKKEGARWPVDYNRLCFKPDLRQIKGRKYQSPVEDKSPDDTGFRIFHPPGIIETVKAKRKIDCLYIVEGEFKAFKAWMSGVKHIIGIPSKDGALDKKKKLLPDIHHIIKTCSPKNIVLLLDGDCREIHWDPKSDDEHERKKDLYKRPRGFYVTCRNFREACKELGSSADIYFMHVKEGHPKGIDDLLIKVNDKAKDVVDEILIREKSGRFISTLNLMDNSLYDLLEYFHIKNVRQFYDAYQSQLANYEFIYKGEGWRFEPAKEIRKLVKTFTNSNFFEDGNSIWKKAGEGSKQTNMKIANFNMSVLYQIVEGENAWNIVQVQNEEGIEKVFTLNVEDFVSLQSFQKIVRRFGSFIWRGTAPDLLDWQEKALYGIKLARQVSYMGWQDEGLFVWSNGATCQGGFVKTDNYGMIKVANQSFFLPAASVHSDPAKYKDDLRYVYKERNDYPFQKWAADFIQLYGENSHFGIAFSVATLFLDIIFEARHSFPLLFSFGQPDTGKSSFCRALTCLWGRRQSDIMLTSASSVKHIIRKAAQGSNSLIWFDEWSEKEKAVRPEIKDAIKNSWNRSGYGGAEKSASNRTFDIEMRMSIAVSGEHMPSETATFTRFIMLEFTKDKYTPEEKEFYARYQENEDIGLTHITHELLQHRQLIQDKFKETYKRLYFSFTEAMKKYPSAQNRVIENMAALFAPITILEEAGKIQYPLRTFGLSIGGMAVAKILDQSELIRSGEMTNKFFDVMQSLIRKRLIREYNEFVLNDGKLFIRMKMMHPAYSKEHWDIYRETGMQMNTLIRYLRHHPAFEGHTNTRLFDQDRIQQVKALLFNYKWLVENDYDFAGNSSDYNSGEIPPEDSPSKDLPF